MDVLRLLDELRVLAQAGLFWAERNDHPYDKGGGAEVLTWNAVG